MALFSLAAVVVGVLALAHLDSERQRIESTLDPAALASQQLYSALLNQETGVRGYALTGQPDFLAPYTAGLRGRARRPPASFSSSRRSCPPPAPRSSRPTLTQAHDWRTRYAEPTIKQIQASGKPVVSPDILAGKAEFDALRVKFAAFQADVSSTRTQALASLDDASDELHVALLAIAIGLVVGRGGAGPRAAQHRDPPGAPARGRGAAGRRRRLRRTRSAQTGPQEIRGPGAPT